MGVEAIGGIGRVASVAPAISRGASFGAIGRIGVAGIEGGISKAASYAENRGPSLLNPLGIEVIRNPFIVRPLVEVIHNPFEAEPTAQRPQLRAADVIAEAEAIVARTQIKPRMFEVSQRGNLVRTPEPMVVWPPKLVRGLDVRVITNPFAVLKVEVTPQSMMQKKAENQATSRVIRTTSTPTLSQLQTEQIVEEKKLVLEDKKEDKAQEKRSEKQFLTKIKIVEAVKITQLRRSAVFEAARKAKEEAEKTVEKVIITGKKLKKFLSGEFWKYISPLVGRVGYDGTIPLTLNAIENNPIEYTNLEEAQTKLSQPVAEHIPLQKGEGGRVATIEEVREVLEGKEKEVIKLNTPAEMVVRRVVRKNVDVIKSGQVVNTVVEEKEDVAGEPTLKSLDLKELFPKAA